MKTINIPSGGVRQTHAHACTHTHTHTLLCRVSVPQVVVTPHIAFLTDEALDTIATVTIQNIANYVLGESLGENELKYTVCEYSFMHALCVCVCVCVSRCSRGPARGYTMLASMPNCDS